MGSAVVAHRFSCSKACGIFLNHGSNPCPLLWQVNLNHWATREVPQFSYYTRVTTSENVGSKLSQYLSPVLHTLWLQSFCRVTKLMFLWQFFTVIIKWGTKSSIRDPRFSQKFVYSTRIAFFVVHQVFSIKTLSFLSLPIIWVETFKCVEAAQLERYPFKNYRHLCRISPVKTRRKLAIAYLQGNWASFQACGTLVGSARAIYRKW